jgi:hypothetical protein
MNIEHDSRLQALVHKLQVLVNRVKKLEKSKPRSGSLLLIEREDNNLRRITATVESGDRYLNRTGWKSLKVPAQVTYSTTTNNLAKAREGLRVGLQNQRIQLAGNGMEWADVPKEELISIIESVARAANEYIEEDEKRKEEDEIKEQLEYLKQIEKEYLEYLDSICV